MKKNKKESKFKGKVTNNAKKQASQGASYGYLNLPKGVNVFSAEPGSKVKFDIVPYLVTDPKHMDRDEFELIAVPGELWYKKPFKVHRNVGVSRDSAICLSTFGKKCPICEIRAQRMKEGAEKEETDAMKPSLRNLYVIVPKGMKKHEEEPHIWDISQYLFQNLLNEELEENEDYGIFPDLEEGLTLKVRFDSKQIGKGNPFAEASRIDFLDREEQYEESFMDGIPNLDDLLAVLSYKELEVKFLEMEEDEDDEEEEKPKRSKKDLKKHKKEIIEDDDEDDDDDEEEKPKRKSSVKKGKKKPIIEDDDDDDDDEDDEDECIACGGTGTNSKGKECPICKGTGYKIPKETDDDEEEDDVIPVIKKEKDKKHDKTDGKNKCPFKHKFGVDCDEYDDCNDCDLWNDCIEEKENS